MAAFTTYEWVDEEEDFEAVVFVAFQLQKGYVRQLSLENLELALLGKFRSWMCQRP